MNHMQFYSQRLNAQKNHMGADPFGLSSVSDLLNTSFEKANKRMTSMDAKSTTLMEKTGKLSTLAASIGRRTTITAGIALLYVAFLYIRPIRRKR